ncbi:hypothetical protein FRB93_007249 [Tulasnella sp. JGI-2019a]|nr:hypothetical protein FRB93_007249 [Tulasnella sp. JGI-2019a]
MRQKYFIPLSAALSPLIQCEPKKLRDSSFWGAISGAQTAPEHWDRYKRDYGRRIAHLIVDIDPDTISESNPERPAAWSQVGPIFPNLVSLRFDIEGHATEEDEPENKDRWTYLVKLLIGPDLKNLTLSVYDVTKEVVEKNIQALANIAPHINDVQITNNIYIPLNYAPFTSMKSLRVEGHIDHDGWKALANCTHLERIELWEDDSGLEVHPQDYSVTFPQLGSLSIADCCGFRDRSFIVSLFHNTTMPMLWRLEVGIQTYTAAMSEVLRVEILGSVRGRCPLLKELRIDGPILGYSDITHRMISGH